MKDKHVVEFHSQKAERGATTMGERDFTLQVRPSGDANYLSMTNKGLESFFSLRVRGRRN